MKYRSGSKENDGNTCDAVARRLCRFIDWLGSAGHESPCGSGLHFVLTKIQWGENSCRVGGLFCAIARGPEINTRYTRLGLLAYIESVKALEAKLVVENVPHFNYGIQWHRGILSNMGALVFADINKP